MGSVDLAIVHHANQYMITNGYRDRDGLDDIIGLRGGDRGYLKILELHKKYRIPFNLQLSGTLLETALWHRPDFLHRLRILRRQGVLDFIGSCYAQNTMFLYGPRNNSSQLNEEIRLYRRHLGVKPQSLRVFWPPQGFWDTGGLAPSLADKHLLNKGYEYVLLDDHRFYLARNERMPREGFHHAQERSVTDFLPCRIRQGHGLTALPISVHLKQKIPPREKADLEKLEEVFYWLAKENSQAEGGLIAIYGDGLEKSAGCLGWDESGPAHYETLLKWLVRNSWVHPVKLNEWTVRCEASQEPVEIGTRVETSSRFGQNENPEEWYSDPGLEKYRRYFAWSQGKVMELSALGADPGLLEMAWKHLLASSWETAWHAPRCSAQDKGSFFYEPSRWARAIASHSRHAAVIVQAAYWMKHKDQRAHAYLADLDDDGHEELILKNDRLFAVFSPSYGGRLVYLFKIGGRRGKMVIGNPCDDWNWIEELNKYMEMPPNHPGALAEVRHENDRYEAVIIEPCGTEARAVLVNKEESSQVIGLEKSLKLQRDKNEIEVVYQLPQDLPNLSVECGLSPDYFHLVRLGRDSLKATGDVSARGYSNNGVSVWVRLGDPTQTVFSETTPREFGHGYAVQFKALNSPFTVWIGTK